MTTMRARSGPAGRPSLQMLAALPRQVRLCWRLLGERRVGLAPKALLVGALAYVALPFDLLPDFLPGLGQLDDLTLLVTAAWWFVRLCPGPVVAEHQAAIDATAP